MNYQFRYCFDRNNFKNIDKTFTARDGRWIGAKAGLFCTWESQINDSGFADFYWFRVEVMSNRNVQYLFVYCNLI